MSKQDEMMTQNEARKAGRRMLERVENIRDIAEALYYWNAEMMASQKCVIMPGDCAVCGQGGIATARGAVISMSPEEISGLIDSGALSKIFNPDDLNAPDFAGSAYEIFGMISAQRNFEDAPHYYHKPELHSAVAVYDVPGPSPEQDTQFSVERAGRRFALVPGVRNDLGTMRECSYAEFNPARTDILAEVNEIDPAQANRTAIFDMIQKAYEAGGSNDVPEQAEIKDPRDDPEFAKLPGVEKLARLNAYTDQMAEREKRADEQFIDNDIPLPGQKRGYPM